MGQNSRIPSVDIRNTYLTKLVKGYPNYRIGVNGKIWSKKRMIFLKPFPHGACGHVQVDLCKDGKPGRYTVHRLVLETFVGPCPEGMECRHLDGNPKNNRLKNLCWGTKKENQADRVKHGVTNRGERQGRSKLTEREVKLIRKNYATEYTGFSCRQLSELFNVSYSCIYAVVNRTSWKHLPED